MSLNFPTTLFDILLTLLRSYLPTLSKDEFFLLFQLGLTHVLQTTVKHAPVVAMDSSQILLLLPLLAI
ncbi:hypothetical protein QL285_055809 [Trifolium repens]|nr:hypothetical protein QL285_055809 [Trifolium repens]